MKTALTILLVAFAAALLPGQWLELQRGGAPWHVLTCHFTHWTLDQLAWDGLTFAALATACARRDRMAFQITLIASALIVPVAALALTPSINSYRGLSGLASALFALLLTQSRRNWPVVICAAGFGAKIAYEALAGHTVFVQNLGAGVVPVPMAHVAGALVGLTVGLIFRRVQSRPCAKSLPSPSCSPA